MKSELVPSYYNWYYATSLISIAYRMRIVSYSEYFIVSLAVNNLLRHKSNYVYIRLVEAAGDDGRD